MNEMTPCLWSWLTPPASHHREYRAGAYWRDLTIADLARDHAMREPDTLAFLDLGEDPTYGRLLADAEALCASIIRMGLKPGDVISFQTPNWIEAAVINLAAAIGGFVINPIITIYRDAEVRQMLSDCSARLFFLCESFRSYDFAAMIERLRPDLPALEHVAFVRSARPGSYEEMVAAGRGSLPDAPRVDPDQVKLLLYTSGTTGRPKGVLHSHNTLDRVVRMMVADWGIEPGDPLIMPSPVTHISGYTNGLELPFLARTRTVLMENWNAEAALSLIERYGVTGTVAATPFLQELAVKARERGTRLPSLKFFACGGAAVPPEVIRTANAAFENCNAFRVFGSSEVPLVTLGWPHAKDRERAATSDGRIVDYDVRIVDDEDRPLPDNTDGEILARGPAMMMGYADQEQSRAAITEDGFFRTGDIGRRTSDGAILITDRKKDLIIRGGENLSAKEIEDVLHMHPGVSVASVVAMPHDRLGEGVCAFVVAKPGVTLSDPELVAAVKASGLANQKIPERFVYRSELPMTASGKVRKDVLRTWAREGVPD